MIHYMLPDFMIGEKPYTLLQSLQECAPEVLYPNQKVQFIYGCPPNVIWNGGTVLCSERFYLMPEMKHIVNYYNNVLHYPIAWTFTNPLLTETDCYDRYCNLLVELGHNGMNYILVSSPILESYLRDKYPNYHYCKSILAAENAENYKNDYSFSVLERKRNNDFMFLNNLPTEIRPKIEILATDACDPDCPYIYTHYYDYAKAQLAFDASNTKQLDCHFRQKLENNPLMISKQQIDEVYAPLGYTHFKLSGRTSIEAIIDNITKYFVLPEHQKEIEGELYGFINRK